MADLALGDELGHRADRVLDRRARVDTVLVVEVDALDSQPPERCLARLPHIRGAAVDRPPGRIAGFEPDAELGRQEHLLAAVGDRAADEFLVGVRPVHVGGVEEVAPEIERAVDRPQRLGLIGRAVERRHAHAAEADGGDLGAVRARVCASAWLRVYQPAARRQRHNVEAVFPLNLPNVLTVLRIMLVPALVVALLGNTPDGDVIAAIVFALASLTDFVDGYLARARDSITTFGKLMDPLADKLLIIAALISLVSLHRLAAWVAMVIITRELAVTVLRLGATQAGVVMAASMFGKVKTCLQIAAILAIIAVHGQPLWVVGPAVRDGPRHGPVRP